MTNTNVLFQNNLKNISIFYSNVQIKTLNVIKFKVVKLIKNMNYKYKNNFT